MQKPKVIAVSEPVEQAQRRLVLSLRGVMHTLKGQWQWPMQSGAVFCADAMVAWPEDFTGTRAIIHPDDLKAVEKSLHHVQAGKEALFQFRIITTYGEVKAIDGKNIALLTEDEAPLVQSPLGLLEEQATALKEANHNRQQLTVYGEASQFTKTGVWAYNKQTGDTWYSDGCFRMYKLQPQTLNAHLHTFQPFLHPDDREAVLDAKTKAVAEQLPLHITYRVMCNDLTVCHLREVMQWTFNERGQLLLTGSLQDVSEERAADEATQQTGEKLRLERIKLRRAEEAGNMGFFEVNLHTRQAFFSDNMYRLLGIKAGSRPAGVQTVLDAIHPDDRVEAQRTILADIAGHTVTETSVRFLRSDGRLRTMRRTGRVLPNDKGQPIFIGLWQDVTKLTGLERELERSRAELKLRKFSQASLEEATGTSNWLWNLSDNTIKTGDKLFHLLGLKPHSVELSHAALLQHVLPEDRDAVQDAFAALHQRPQEQTLAFRLLRRSETRYIQAAFKPMEQEGNTWLAVSLQDVTDNHHRRRLLEERDNFAQTLVDNSENWVLATDINHNITVWNKQFEKTYGIKKEKAIGQSFFAVFPELQSEEIISHVNRVIGGETVYLENYRLTGTRERVNISLAPVLNDAGQVTGLLHVLHDVTREAQLREQLTHRLSFIENLLEASVDRIIVLDGNMNYQYWNKRAEDYYGITKEEVIGKNILELFPAFVSDPSYLEVRRALRGETVHIPSKQNLEERKGYYETYLIPIKNERGDTTGVLWIVHDLTHEYLLQSEQRLSQERLAHEHRRLKEAQALGHVGSFEWTQGEPFSHWSDELFRIHGLEPGEVETTMEVVHRFIHPDDRARVMALMEESLQTAGSYQLVHRIYTKAGALRWVNHQWQSTADTEGVVVNVMGIVQDITGQKTASEEIIRLKDEVAQQATDRYRHLYNAIDEGFCVIEAIFDDERNAVDFRYVDVNPAFEQQAGMDCPLGKTIRQMVPGINPEIIHHYAGVLRSGQPKRFEYEVPELGKWFDLYVAPFGSADQHQLTVLFYDITERKRREANLAFLAEISLDLVGLTDIAETMNVIGAKIGAHLGLSACIFGELFGENEAQITEIKHGWHRADTPSLLGTYQMSEYMTLEMIQMCRAAEPIIIRDVFADPKTDGQQYKALNIGSFVGMPLIRDGEWRFLLVVYRSEPHDWSREEVELIQELTTRIWTRLERAHAEKTLQESEEKYRTLFNSIDEAFVYGKIIVDGAGTPVDYRILQVNPAYEKMTGLRPADVIGKTVKEITPGIEEVWIATVGRVAIGGETIRFENRAAELNRWFETFLSPAGTDNDGHFVAVFKDVTERKQAEEALRASEEKYHTVFDSLHEGVSLLEVLFDSDGNAYDIIIRDANEAQNRIDGVKAVIGKRVREILPGIEMKWIERYAAIARTGVPENFVDWSEANQRWYAVAASRIGGDGSHLVVTAYNDITEIKQAEKTLQNFNQQLEHQVAERTAEIEKTLAILKQTEAIDAIGSWEYEIATGRFTWSEGMYRLFNIPQGVTVKPSFYQDACVMEDYSVARRILKAIQKTHKPFTEELRMVRPGDSVRLIRVKASVVKDESGAPQKMIGVDLDITEIREAQNKLKAQDLHTQTLIDASIDQITIFDRDERFLVWNKKAEEAGGLKREDVIGRTISEVFPDIAAEPEFIDAQRQALAGESVYIPAKRGFYSTAYQQWFYVPLKNEKGEVYAVMNIIHDITDKVQAEEQLKRKNQQLQERNEEIAHFNFIASHDLKEPLRKVGTFSNWLVERESGNLSDTGKQMLQKLTSSVQRMELLVDDISTLTQLQKVRGDLEAVELNIVLRKALASLQGVITAVNAVVDGGNLPIIPGYKEQLETLFVNLISNGIKFQKEGMIPAVEISCKRRANPIGLPRGEWYCLSFADNGIGFDMQYNDKIFRVFQRLHGQSEYPGTGIGLAICRKVMENHGGFITAASEPGKGARFDCWFPVV